MACMRRTLTRKWQVNGLARGMSDECGDRCGDTNLKKGLVLGVYDGKHQGEFKFTATGAKFDSMVGGRLTDLAKRFGVQKGKAKVFNDLGPEFYGIALAGLGPQDAGYNEDETLNECKENIRVAAAVGAQALQKMDVARISVEGFTNAEAAAEGATLGIWRFQKYKKKDNRMTAATVCLYDDPDKDGWDRGVFKAQSQNIARELEETPANLMTPSKFAKATLDILCPCGVQVDIRDRDWIEYKNMTAMLGITRSSCEPPLFLELSYCGGGEEDKPVILVGKGVTFDSGAVCLRVAKGMSEYKADMAGAAVCVAVMRCLATLQIPINVSALIPLVENMPGGQAAKPGDVIFSLSHKTIRLKDTSKEGRVLLADALTYANNYKPCLVLSIGTITEGIRTALGASSTGVFSNSKIVWEEMKLAGADTGDRVWRMPLWEYFSRKVTSHAAFDVINVGTGKGGDPCVGAAFLMQFVPPVDYAHLDITGTGMLSTGSYPYLRKGFMTGRPTRTITQFLYQMACPQDAAAPC